MSGFFSSKCSLFHNSNAFGPCIIHILYTGCAKIKKNNSGAKRLTFWRRNYFYYYSHYIYILYIYYNLLAPELFFLILAHPVYKM